MSATSPRILCAALEERQAKQVPVLDRVIGALLAAAASACVLDTDDFIVDNNRINIADDDVFERDPVNLIRCSGSPQKHNLAFHPDAMQLRRPARSS